MQRQKPRRLVCAALIFAAACNIATAQRVNNRTAISSDSPKSGEVQGIKSSVVTGYAIPAAMIVYGAVSLRSGSLQSLDCKTRDKLVAGGHCIDSNAGDFLCAVPAAAAFVMKAAGVESRNKTTDMLAMYALSNVAQAGIVFGAKNWAKRERPDASDCSSFPSAHTAIAFTAAEFLRQEYGGKSPWISIGGYTIATAVGVSRILNNKHWTSDVIAGAGIGILCTKGVYLLYPSLKNKIVRKHGKPQTLFLPDYSNGLVNLKFVRAF